MSADQGLLITARMTQIPNPALKASADLMPSATADTNDLEVIHGTTNVTQEHQRVLCG